MTLDTAILKNIEKLPESIKQSVFLYTEFLVNQYTEKEFEKSDNQQPKKRRLAGSMKGTFVLPLPDDFNDPIDDFEEYM
jgi:hypothetical protein